MHLIVQIVRIRGHHYPLSTHLDKMRLLLVVLVFLGTLAASVLAENVENLEKKVEEEESSAAQWVNGDVASMPRVERGLEGLGPHPIPASLDTEMTMSETDLDRSYRGTNKKAKKVVKKDKAVKKPKGQKPKKKKKAKQEEDEEEADGNSARKWKRERKHKKKSSKKQKHQKHKSKKPKNKAKHDEDDDEDDGSGQQEVNKAKKKDNKKSKSDSSEHKASGKGMRRPAKAKPVAQEQEIPPETIPNVPLLSDAN